MLKGCFKNTGKYVQLILRRERLSIPIWVLAIVILVLLLTIAYPELSPTEHERQIMAETMNNPAITAMFGPAYSLDDYHYGIMMGHQMLLVTALIVAIMNIILAARHTRGDEEDGLSELLRSLPVGKLSNLSAVAIVFLGTNVLIGLLIAFGMTSLNVEGIDFAGSLLYGAILAATGVFFACITILFAQINQNFSGVVGFSLAFLGISYLVRAIGDVGYETLSFISPLGWIGRAEPYASNNWWPVILMLGVAAILFAIATYLNWIRDMGAGFLPEKQGASTASRFLQSPLGLAFRLQKTGIIAWCIGVFVLGAMYGSVMGDLESYFDSMEFFKDLFPVIEGVSLTEQFIPMLMSIMAVLSTVPVLMFFLKLRTEEKKNLTEHLLTRAVSRRSLLSSYLLISILASIVIQFLAVVGLWATWMATTNEAASFIILLQAAAAYLPAIWIMVGFSVLLLGFWPKGTGVAWIYLAYSFFAVYIGEIIQLPEWVVKLSPFGHVSQIPVESMNYTMTALLTLVAITLGIAGYAGFKNRDIQA
jgi:ABC-2 type transport system permease protein